jgi:hypothetical protein
VGLFEQFAGTIGDLAALLGAGLESCKARDDKRFTFLAAKQDAENAGAKADMAGDDSDVDWKIAEAQARFVQSHQRCLRDCGVLVHGFGAEFSTAVEEFLLLMNQLAVRTAEDLDGVRRNATVVGDEGAVEWGQITGGA